MLPLQIRDTTYILHTRGGHDEIFQLSDMDDSSDPKYFGYISSTGAYIIIQETTSAGTYRYAGALSGYTTAWTGRAALSYGYYNALFS